MNMHSYKCCQPNKEEAEKIEAISSLLKLVAEENRLKLICILRQGECCVCEMNNYFDMSQSLISHHLSSLRKEELVDSRRDGRRKYYFLTQKGEKISDLIFDLLKEVS